MRIAFATDQRTGLADAILEHLRNSGHEIEVLANVIALSIRLTTETVAAEIHDACLSADAYPGEADAVCRFN